MTRDVVAQAPNSLYYHTPYNLTPILDKSDKVRGIHRLVDL